MRWAQISAEGSVGGYSLLQTGTRNTGFDAYQASAALKASLPLGNNFEVFGRGGLQHLWLKGADPEFDASGNGFLLGAGFEYRLNLGIGQGSIFIDYQFNKAKLDGDNMEHEDLSSRMWTLGLTVGI